MLLVNESEVKVISELEAKDSSRKSVKISVNAEIMSSAIRMITKTNPTQAMI